MESKNEQKLMEDTTNEALKEESNISKEHKLTVQTSKQALASKDIPQGQSDVEGIDNSAMSLIKVPWLRLIQPTSMKTEDSKGKESMPGTYLMSDSLKNYEELNFVILRAKRSIKEFERDGIKTPSQRLDILGITIPENKLFILSLSVTSFSNWGRLMSQFKDMHLDKSWRFSVRLNSEKVENDKGKFYIADFKLGDELEKELITEMQNKALEYGLVLDREFIEEE